MHVAAYIVAGVLVLVAGVRRWRDAQRDVAEIRRQLLDTL